MSKARVTCSDCGDVKIDSNGISIRVCEDDRSATYLFRCPKCRMIEVRECNDNARDILIACDCEIQTWRLPAELKDRKRFVSWSPSTRDEMIDELLDFRRWLETAWSHEVYAALIGPVSNTELCQFRADVYHAEAEAIMRELFS